MPKSLEGRARAHHRRRRRHRSGERRDCLPAPAPASLSRTCRARPRPPRRSSLPLPGSGHAALPADVADTPSLLALRDVVRERYGDALHVLVNAAGFTKPVPHADLDALDDELIDRMFAVNWRGQFATIRTFAPMLKASGDGLIVSISSIAANTGVGSSIAYCAAKAGIDVMTKSLARALAPEIRVMSVAPGRRRHRFRARTRRGLQHEDRRHDAAAPHRHRGGHRRGRARLRDVPALLHRLHRRRRRRPFALRSPMREPLPRVFITAAVTGNLTTPGADAAFADHARADRRRLPGGGGGGRRHRAYPCARSRDRAPFDGA